MKLVPWSRRANFKSKNGFIFVRKEAKGFTLVELLVVIAVLAVISGIGLVVYNNANVVGKDSRRKEDLRSIQTALQLYHAANGHYPVPYGGYTAAVPHGPTDIWTNDWVHSTDGSDWIPGMEPDFISTMPVDPLNKYNGGGSSLVGSSTDSRIYAYKSDNSSEPGITCPYAGDWYALAAVLDNYNDKDSIQNTNQTWCDGTTPAKNLIYMGSTLDVLMQHNNIGVFLIIVRQ